MVKDKQLELLPRRVRVPMLELEDRRFGQPHAGHGLDVETDMETGDVEFRVRLPKKAAAVVTQDPEAAREHMETLAQRMHDELCTAWESKAKPPMIGYWDITDHKTGTVRDRWWFGGVLWQPSGRGSNPLHHDEFVKRYAWRGLRSSPAGGYPVPPYQAAQLPAGTHTYLAYLTRSRERVEML